MRCDIIIPVWNQVGITEGCISSIQKGTRYTYSLIIVDNGSDEATRDYLDSLKARMGASCSLVRNDENLGFPKAVNQGLRLSNAPYACVMNNDTIVTDGWLESMVKVMEACPQIGILNPSSNTSGQSPASGESIDDYAARLTPFEGAVQELSVCRGFCMLLKREVIAKVGLFDETYKFGYFEETDYCRRASEAGFGMARAKAAYVYHIGNASFKALGESEVIFKRNENIFFSKWGRPVRVGYFVDRVASREAINGIAASVARSGNQILIFLKRGLEWPVDLDHFDIRRVDLNPVFFGFMSVYNIFKRKRKKRLEMLLTDNRTLGLFLKAVKGLHGADVVLNPDVSHVLRMTKERSKNIH